MPAPPVRLLSLQDIQRKLSISRTALWAFQRRRGFPAPILIGESKRYIEAEIDAWLLTQPRATGGEDGVHEPATAPEVA